MKVAAHKVKAGQYLRRSTGEVIKVICSNAERQSAASASFGTWEITGYSEGNPTRRVISDPNALMEVVG